ncbi:MAG: hypothetical protein QOJ15_6761 [Bradyrhizobium sp.]|jgi:hypothetical protein|nr:hypothetical protein [Bradyrhizobium sp.]
MPIKNNDDVAHLLEATGRAGSSYREFESPSDQMSAPLIDAVFASGPVAPAPADERPLAGAGQKSDLLSEVFDRPVDRGHPEAVGAVGSPSTAARQAEIAPHLSNPFVSGPNASPRRSLGDIRRIISQPSAEAVEAPPTDSLHGLFDRLAG